jgi:hypothetical protein
MREKNLFQVLVRIRNSYKFLYMFLVAQKVYKQLGSGNVLFLANKATVLKETQGNYNIMLIYILCNLLIYLIHQ